MRLVQLRIDEEDEGGGVTVGKFRLESTGSRKELLVVGKLGVDVGLVDWALLFMGGVWLA